MRIDSADKEYVDLPLPNYTSARAVLNALLHVVWIADPDGFVRWVNAWGRHYFGRSVPESLGHLHLTLLHPDDQAVARASWTAACQNAETLAVDYRMRVANGDYRWQHVRAKPVKDEKGRVKFWVGTCTDIHEELGRVERLRAQLARRTETNL